MKQLITVILIISFVVSLVAFAFTFTQVKDEEKRLENDISYRSSLLSDSLKESVEPNFIKKSNAYLQRIVEKFSDNTRFAGLAIVDNKGKIVAVSSNLPKEISGAQQIATDVMDSDLENGNFVNFENRKMYVFASPLHDSENVVGSLIIIQNAGYIDTRLTEIWGSNLIRLFIQVSAISIAVFIIVRWLIFLPVKNLADSLRHTRKGHGINEKFGNRFLDSLLFQPLTKEISNIKRSLLEARIAASEEAKLNIEKLDIPWTAERLRQYSRDILKNKTIVAVSHLEPYIHTKNGNNINYYVPASGLITSIEPVMQACGGLWIAEGSGSGDKSVVDKNDKMQVPPNDPKYTLKRIWLSEEETKGFHHGFSDQAMYPLFHMAHTRPVFRENDWQEYKKVNQKFAKAILSEIKRIKKPIIFIQDFQFTLVPKIIKKKRPDAIIGIFWHIPWVSPETFSICPWKKEILDGMLGADLIGFHTQLYCNNFIETVGRELECLINIEQFSVTRNAHVSLIKPFPISIAFSTAQEESIDLQAEKHEAKKLLKSIGVHTKLIGVGVDRLHFIKGVIDRLRGIDVFFEKYPEYIGELTFIQISPPLESKLSEFQEYYDKVKGIVDRINEKYKKNNWKPIVFLNKHHSRDEVYRYYRLANFCLVTSLHEGMNLVAKEYVASRSDEKGVLILSQFTGAAKELKEAIIINPYNSKETAQAIYTAINMPESEQARRIRRLKNTVRTRNIYRWSAEFLRTLTNFD